jgi:DNA-binding transcriptional MerR regulator
LFSLADLDHIQFVMHLTQKEGLNLQGVKVLLEAIRLSHEKGFDLRKALFPTFSPKKLL